VPLVCEGDYEESLGYEAAEVPAIASGEATLSAKTSTASRLQHLGLEYANKRQVPVALVVIQPIAHDKSIWDIKTSEGHG
jgi:hypothetical protein